MMKSLVQLANACLNDDVIRAQFEFAQDGGRVYGVAAGKGVWYTLEECNLYTEKQLFPVPNCELEDADGIVYKEADSYYPFDEFKCSKLTADRLADWIGMYEYRNFVKVDKLPAYLLLLDGKCYTLKDTIEPSDIPLWNNALPPVPECSGVIDMVKTLGKLLGQLNKKSIKGYGIHIQKNKTPIVHVNFTKGYAAIPAAMLPSCKINGYEIIADENGILTEKGKEIMRERLGSLKSFNTEVSEPTVDEVVQDINLAAVLKEAEVKVEPVSKVVPLEVNENKVVPLEVKPVLPVDIPKPPTPIELPEVAPLEQKVQEKDTITTTAEEPTPVTIDSLRYQFTEVKTMVAAFDKALREYAKVGACNKKTQAELDKLKNENLKLKEEIKKLIKDSEQLTKLKKLMSALND